MGTCEVRYINRNLEAGPFKTKKRPGGLLQRVAPVRLDGRVVGEVRNVGGSWQYFPRGQKHGGDIFVSFTACCDSLVSA